MVYSFFIALRPQLKIFNVLQYFSFLHIVENMMCSSNRKGVYGNFLDLDYHRYYGCT